MERSAEIAINEAMRFLDQQSLPERVVFVCYGHDALSIYLDRARNIVPEFEG